jgi:chromosome segregation ATPase
MRCEICGFEARTSQGLSGHKQFKHGIIKGREGKAPSPLATKEEIERMVELLKGEIRGISYGVAELRSSVKKLEERQEGSSSEVSRLRSSIEALERKVEGLSSDVKSFRSASSPFAVKEEVKRAAGQLRKDIGDLSSEIGELKRRQGEVSADLKGIKGQIDPKNLEKIIEYCERNFDLLNLLLRSLLNVGEFNALRDKAEVRDGKVRVERSGHLRPEWAEDWD